MMEIIKNCMPERKGKCVKCGKVGYVCASKDWWDESFCYDCATKGHE